MYSRVAGEAPQLLAAEVATAVGLCGRLVAVGTRRGAVVLYDTQGKLARPPRLQGRGAGLVRGADSARSPLRRCAACHLTAPRSTTSVLTPPERMSRPLPRTATSRCGSAF